MSDANSVQPPWIMFPNSDPVWSGWRQGPAEAWLLEVFLPFWKLLEKSKRQDYLKRWPPPTDLWRTYLTTYWG